MTSEYLLDVIGKIKSETIEKNAIIEKNAKQGKNAIIEINAKQGKNVIIEENVKQGKNAIIEKNVKQGKKETFENNAITENNAIGTQNKKNRAVNWVRYAAVAAALVLMIGAGFLVLHQHGIIGNNGSQGGGSGNMAGSGNVAGSEQERTEVTGSIPTGSGQDSALASGAGNDKEAAIDQKPEKYVEIASLFPVRSGNVSYELSLRVTNEIKVGTYKAIYEETAHEDGTLAESLGAELEENAGWYKVSGHEEQQYLIHKEAAEKDYSLWKFASFDAEEYPYADVLRLIYGVQNAGDFIKITEIAAKMDNSDAGKRLQQEIGQQEITDSEDLKRVYGILSQMTCYGNDRWDRIDYGADDNGMLEAVRLGRYLTIDLANGSSIDSLKYSAVGGMFYEFGGVAYNRLSARDCEMLERILMIQRSGNGTDQDSDTSKASRSDNGEASGIASDDAPVDESTYQEAHRYSDEIEVIQAAISEAMSKGDLPFVISSGIYENPVRIVVRVNTRDKKLIDQVMAFDTAGGVVEVEYSDGKARLE